jgi:hypothetical protein
MNWVNELRANDSIARDIVLLDDEWLRLQVSLKAAPGSILRDTAPNRTSLLLSDLRYFARFEVFSAIYAPSWP